MNNVKLNVVDALDIEHKFRQWLSININIFHAKANASNNNITDEMVLCIKRFFSIVSNNSNNNVWNVIIKHELEYDNA